jgi:hypothetical protein
MCFACCSLDTPAAAVKATVSDDPGACTATLSRGLGSFALALAAPVTYTLTATYDGDCAYARSSDTGVHTVEKPGLRVYLRVIRRN